MKLHEIVRGINKFQVMIGTGNKRDWINAEIPANNIEQIKQDIIKNNSLYLVSILKQVYISLGQLNIRSFEFESTDEYNTLHLKFYGTLDNQDIQSTLKIKCASLLESTEEHIFYHYSNNPAFKGIEKDSFRFRFGAGFFVMPTKELFFYGKYGYKVIVQGDILSNREFEQLIYQKQNIIKNWIKKEFNIKILKTTVLEDILWLLEDETNAMHYSETLPNGTDKELIRDIFKVDIDPELNVEIQRVRGEFAHMFGYAGIQVNDENGQDAVFLCDQTKIKSIEKIEE